ncbi:MAG: MOSC N-terminal beta barrel domain-containing protein [Oxalobacteraceae bacterium]|nr:MOSC N-terminal beta barrel domain-containing protein [Oxalobacteraceae bacterium]
MATLTELNFYPIKSCGAIALQQATLTPAGLMHDSIHDREWMVVDMQGNFITQREHPALARITPRIDGGRLKLRAPGMLELEIPLDLPDPEHAPTVTVRVWDDTLSAYDCDAVTARWFSQALAVPCRLVRFHPHASRVTNTRWTADADVPALFSDGYPFLLISQASLADLNQKLAAQGRAPLPMNRFRPNLVIDGITAFEEDFIEILHIGEAGLKPVKPCARCPIPSIDQATGIVGDDPLDILRSYRANPKVDGGITFGMNVTLQQGDGQSVHIGQEIDITLAF